MRICLIGGIYGEGGTPSGYLRVTPETTLEAGLKGAGHDVTTLSHYANEDFGRFDVVHVHHLSYGATRLACDPSPAPFVFTPHDASQMSGMTLSLERALALRYVLARADGVVSLSDAEAAYQTRVNRVEPGRVSTIPNGIDADRFPYRRSNSAGQQRPWQLLFVGQLIELKGCDILLRAVASLGLNVELTLAYQSADLESELKSLASILGITGRVRFAGRQEPGRLAELYQQSDLLVLASRTEALPSVITESMMSGLPFVSTDVGGIREQAAGFGHLVPSRSVDALTAGIRHVLTHFDDFAARAAEMSRHARERYSIQTMVDRHLTLYRAITDSGPRRHAGRYAAGNALVRAALRRFGRRGRPAHAAAEIPEHHTAAERS